MEGDAQVPGQSGTDFTEAAPEEKANAVPSENESIILSEEAFSGFLTAISGAPDNPSEKLLRAVADYNRHEPVTAETPPVANEHGQ